MPMVRKISIEKSVVKIVLIPLYLYQYLISPMLGANCRFEPSCSCYVSRALTEHGLFKGGYLACTRLMRCHPFGGCGYDPVPPKCTTFKMHNQIKTQKPKEGRMNNDNRNLIAAIAISILILIVYQIYFIPPETDNQQTSQQAANNACEQYRRCPASSTGCRCHCPNPYH